MRAGDKGNNFYLIKDGTCEVVAEEGGVTFRKLLGPGDSCGELSLLTGNPRSATVTVRWTPPPRPLRRCAATSPSRADAWPDRRLTAACVTLARGCRRPRRSWCC